jgi:ribosomal protein L20A (L18A)
MKFRVKGTIETKEGTKKFSREIDAESSKLARHKLFSFFGNVYRLTRRKIQIIDVSKI